MDPVSFVASITQLIKVTRDVVQYFEDVKDAPKAYALLEQEAYSLLEHLSKLKARAAEAKKTDAWFTGVCSLGVPNGPLAQYQQAMEELARTSKPKLGQRWIWPFRQKEVEKILKRIERLKSIILLALQDDLK